MKAKPKGEGGGMRGMKFLAAACLIYVAVGLLSLQSALAGLGAFVDIMASIVPVMVLVFGMMFAANLLLKPRRVARYLGRGSGIKGWLVAVAGGIASTGPVYLWYALLADMREQGMKDSLTAAFIYSRAVKVPLLPLMIYYFGWAFTAVLTIYMVIFSVISGVIVGLMGGKWNEDSGSGSRQGAGFPRE